MNSPFRVSRGQWGGVVVVAVAALVLSGCSVTETPTTFPAGGFAVDVPVLWVGTEADGTEVGGVEATQVWTGSSESSKFSVDLSGIEAEGAGDAWRAASASAAAVATLTSGTDPTSVDIQFHISSPIDGPSAGGILTVGILASLRHLPLAERVTMTGTISPDGSIGPIGGVLSKVAAAAEAGYETVVIPEGNRSVRNSAASNPVDLVKYGAARGITVIPVAQLSDAFAILTGEPLLSLQPRADSTVSESLADFVAQRSTNIHDLLDQTSALLASRSSEEASTLFKETQSALDRGELDLASGLARETYLAAWRVAVEAQTQDPFSPGIPVSIAALSFRIDSALERGQAAVTEVTSQEGLSDSQYASMSEMLLGVITAQAALDSVAQALPSVASESEVIRISHIVADQEAAIDVFFPLDASLLSLTRGIKEIRSPNPVAFLSNYTNFLVQAGEANMTYLGSVLQASEDLNQHTVASFDTLYPVLVTLAEKARTVGSGVGGLSKELTEAAYGLALYVNSAALVSQAQALRLFNTGIGEMGDLGENPVATVASIANAVASVTASANSLAEEGWDPAYSLAQAHAGAAFATNQLSAASSTNSVARGLQRLWAASVAVQLMKAAPE
jgi:hypothetical protein